RAAPVTRATSCARHCGSKTFMSLPASRASRAPHRGWVQTEARGTRATARAPLQHLAPPALDDVGDATGLQRLNGLDPTHWRISLPRERIDDTRRIRLDRDID